MSDVWAICFWGTAALGVLGVVANLAYDAGVWAGRKDMLDETHSLAKRSENAKKVHP